MGLLDINKLNISFKKLLGKAHTQQSFSVSEESVNSNVSMSYSTIFAEEIDSNPISNGGLTNLYDTDGIVEKIRFEIEKIPDTLVGTDQSQGYRLKLPSDYTANGALKAIFSSGDILYNSVGKLQIVPSLYGELKGDGSTEYDPKLYETDESTEIVKFDSINWTLDFYNGVLFIQDPFNNFDISVNRPGYLDGYLFVGEYLDDKTYSGGTSGDTTNKKDVKIITSLTYFVDDEDSYLGCSGVTTIMLPLTPEIGHELIISDIIGDAYINNIIINGNGKNIINDSYGLLNTNYGSVTLLYNGFFWSVISSVS